MTKKESNISSFGNSSRTIFKTSKCMHTLYLSSFLRITLLTKRGGLDAGCSVVLSAGGDRTRSFISSIFARHFTAKKQRICIWNKCNAAYVEGELILLILGSETKLALIDEKSNFFEVVRIAPVWNVKCPIVLMLRIEHRWRHLYFKYRIICSSCGSE